MPVVLFLITEIYFTKTLCTFKVYNVLIWFIYVDLRYLQYPKHNKLFHISVLLYMFFMPVLLHASSELPNFRGLQIISFSLPLTQLNPLYIMSLRRKSTYCIHGKRKNIQRAAFPQPHIPPFHLGINTLTLGVTMAYIDFLCITYSGLIFPIEKRAGRSCFELF